MRMKKKVDRAGFSCKRREKNSARGIFKDSKFWWEKTMSVFGAVVELSEDIFRAKVFRNIVKLRENR
jgi:hypothetical protein